MSYTMTLDIPESTAEYIKGKGPSFLEELSALFVAIVDTKKQYDHAEADETPGPSLLESFREGDDILSGKKATKWYKSADELVADCLA